MSEDEKFMAEALAEARQVTVVCHRSDPRKFPTGPVNCHSVSLKIMGYEQGGAPVGAVLVRDGEIIGRGRNKWVQEGSVIKHAETDCLENAGRMRGEVYKRCTLYTTLWPCAMCSGAINFYGISRVVVGENKTFSSAGSRFEPVCPITLLDNQECVELMSKFIKEKPDVWNGVIAS